MKNKEYKFNNFKTTKGNNLAFTISKEVAKQPGKKYSSFFISGNNLERTHLLNAIANELEETNHKVSYDINNIKDNTEVLIIDNIENLSSEEKDKLTKIIKSFIDNNKQIVLGSITTLDELNITEELKETILWGISVNIENDTNEANNEKISDYNWLNNKEK